MDTNTLVELIRKCKALAWNEGGAKIAGDMGAMVPLLAAALKDTPAEEIKKAILGYNNPPKQ